ncbi:phosphoribosylformylglycinamidine synthase subunit PurL [Planktothrix sp. FACHB-1365]|uniref:phosphoribosylformylglycinamidine synthase subunit PurL n=1 Tax=Planktothrix sp. FACHB-1365 TaxID=2692855 RepID=UPI0016831CBF|nr:phosphoribosylformylglycinamidine synthase subunit PurL [Planktothrix sp. FACHB-1365]MBD2485048.1 phosphoribosylformylglycinamidine synthase subunit PurL [Planktothrix sp. FACHB-1365]
MSTEINCPFSAEEIASEGIKPEEYEEIVRRLERHPNKAELGMFGVMWSEHCCYKNSRPLLKQFPTTGERILVGPGENAGVVDFGDGLHIAFKIESHNHPSAIEPFQGAATGVGGILRDIFTMGARPIAALNSLRFGSLEDSRTRQIFKGVVSGISHYGNCLIASERFVWRDNQGIYFDTIGNFVESRLLPNETTTELNQALGIATLSIDPKTQQSCWQPVTRVFKRQTQTLITFRTALGRTLTVTPDHLTLLLEDGQWCVREAKLLKEGDLIPLLINLPLPDFQAVEEIPTLDLLETLNNSHQGRHNVYVQLPETWQPTETIRAELCRLEPSATNRYQYIHKRYLPLPYFLQLETLLNVQRLDILLFRRSGKANYMKAVIKPDETFARFLGYYLSEGCVSANGNTYKIILTFALHEQEYVDDVVQGFKDLGLRPCIEKRQSTIAVYATSWLLGYVLKEVWQCGQGAANKAFPSFVFTWPKHLQREALKGLMRGDGSFTTKTNGSHAKIAFGSTSQKLFEQALALIQSQGAVPSIHYRPSATGEIEGRPYQSLPFWELEVSNISGLTSLTQIFSQDRDEQLVEALNRYQGNRYSFPRFEVSNELAFVKVRSVETHNVELCNVYDVEVENTHLFVTTSGIVTHNCFGVPTVGGEVYFDPAYNGNPLVNAMAIGLMETPEIVKSGASGIGNPVLYVGSTTGRDGMGGASFASAELSEESIQDRPAVQVGDPFLEKSLVEACLEAFKTGAVVAAQDMGAAGITCSTSEMAAKGGVGIELDLDLIPVRETGMVPYEYLLSESQERMLFVAQKGREQELIEIFHRWGLQAVVAGTVIAEPIVRILFKGGIAAEIPADALAENTPLYPREILSEPPEYAQKAWQWTPESLPQSTISGLEINGEFQSWNQVLLTLLDTPSIASKRWVYRQYDHQVQNNTVLVPGGGDAAVIRLRPLEPIPNFQGSVNKGLAATVDCNSRYVYLDPYEGAKATVAEAARNLSCVGAEPVAVTDNLNFGSPEKPIGYWQLAEACRGISDGCKAFNTPVTGGNVSLYNETLDAEGNPESIYPTPVVGMVGLIADLTKICGQAWQNSGDLIYLLGDDKTLPTLGASEYLAVVHHTIAGKPPRVDFELEQKVQAACREGIRQGWIQSAHDCAEGGLAVALAECCMSSQKGAMVKLSLSSTASVRWDNILFAEGGGRILVSVNPENQSVWETYLQQQLGVENDIWQNLGSVGSVSESLQILTADDQSLIEVNVAEMQVSYENAIERRL